MVSLRPTRALTTAFVLMVALTAPGVAQWPPEVKNLQYFPADTDVRELLQTMRGFAFGLGVRCQYCHVGEEGQPIFEFDFASDEKETKRKARTMLAMVAAINGEHLPKLGEEPDDLVKVECVTCHRGAPRPEQLTDILAEIAGEEGAAAALDKYKALRDEFYGSHTYDFSEGTLVRVAEGLAGAGKADAAVELLEFNLEMHAESTWTLGTLAEVEGRRQNVEGAVRALERILELEPDNARVKQRLEQLRAPAAEGDG